MCEGNISQIQVSASVLNINSIIILVHLDNFSFTSSILCVLCHCTYLSGTFYT